MSLRIIGGQFKGRKIKTPNGQATRPTTSRVREAIFAILQHDIAETEILDLFAGSGALSIEALSRGAHSAVLVEKNKMVVQIIRDNLSSLGLEARILACGYQKGLEILSEEGKKFDLAFADPPYDKISPDDLYQILMKYALMKPEGFFIIEHPGKFEPDNEKVIKTRRFGDSAVSIYRCD